jgi:hypothetical protein
MTAKGHFDQFPAISPSGGYLFGQETSAGAFSGDGLAPIAVIDSRRASDCSRPKPNMTGSAYSITSSAG